LSIKICKIIRYVKISFGGLKMKLLKCEKTEKSVYELEIGVENEVFEAAVEKVYRKQVKNINIPGFRKGKAPRAIIEKMYGKGVFFEDAINDIIPTVYTDAIKEADIKDIVAQPEFDIVSTEGENGLVLSAKVYVKPEVEIKDYAGIAVDKVLEPVTDEEIEREINTVRERNSREIEVTDRAAEMGDTAVIDYEGFQDGVAFEGGKGEKHSLKLGSGSFIPGFEEQVAGHAIGEEFDVNVEFPKEYHAEELAGKPAVFKVKIHAINKVELPELDDDFAKDVSEFDTFAEYKADLTAKIEKRHEDKANGAVEEKLIDALIEKLVADIPEPMFVAETENFVRDYDNNLRMSGLDLNTYFKYTGLTLEKLREEFRPRAEKQVKARLALEKIAELEKLEASEEDINGEYDRIAKAYNVTLEQVKESIDASAIAADMKVKKAVDFVKEKAVINTVTEAPAEA
jgi:trigger factor